MRTASASKLGRPPRPGWRCPPGPARSRFGRSLAAALPSGAPLTGYPLRPAIVAIHAPRLRGPAASSRAARARSVSVLGRVSHGLAAVAACPVPGGGDAVALGSPRAARAGAADVLGRRPVPPPGVGPREAGVAVAGGLPSRAASAARPPLSAPSPCRGPCPVQDGREPHVLPDSGPAGWCPLRGGPRFGTGLAPGPSPRCPLARVRGGTIPGPSANPLRPDPETNRFEANSSRHSHGYALRVLRASA
jgi:hypothetical protein